MNRPFDLVGLSASRPIGVSLPIPAAFEAIELATLLDVPRVGRNGAIGQSEKAFGNNSSDFEAIKVLWLYKFQNSQQGVVNLLSSQSPEEHDLDLSREEKEIPSGSMNLSIERAAIARLEHAPAS